MNREIKFRAYHSKYGVGHVISMSFYEKTKEYNSDTECYAYYPKMNDSLLTSYSEVELMQYTGLKDKNGTEIYEGYIVEVDREKSVIESIPGGFTVARLPLVEVSNYGMKVIGNIHENPELLERSE